MPLNKLLTFLSDFGSSDTYVGVMKGIIYTTGNLEHNCNLTIVDLTHEIPAQDLAAARFHLLVAYPYFPAGTVHVAVVDPGVGSSRRAIAVEFANGFLVGPDNGLFSGILDQCPAIAAVELTNPQYWRTPTPSNTFHGRDIFAPVAAHLASGVAISALGQVIATNSLVKLPISDCVQIEPGLINGYIQHIDHFGNLITNIPGTYVEERAWSVIFNHLTIPSSQTYAQKPPGQYLCLIGSHGWVEVAVSNGSAHAQLKLAVGDQVQIRLDLPPNNSAL